MTNYQRTADWLAACGKMPSERNMSLQMGCHFEELAELLDETIITGSSADAASLELVSTRLKGIAHRLKTGAIGARFRSRTAALDALCDAEVTGNGVAYMAGFKKPEADERVLRSNEAKLVDGKALFAPGGKIMKPAGWQAPFLGDLV